MAAPKKKLVDGTKIPSPKAVAAVVFIVLLLFGLFIVTH